ncbi:hypothetical protein DHf2319_12770 [Orrella daihaiensis]|uniref:Uncharacterized protein n=2 Tax=Orrella daihaiensis TaxID=2782176 RepID=A0ABY4AMZ6_9BURK|nr:hypothetical protein DHf2319_12770 [Orrella daihaiensis]
MVLAIFPYLLSTVRGIIRPHVMSWTIWGITTSIVFWAQREAGGGVGAWPVGFSALVAFLIAATAYTKRGDVRIVRSDWVFFLTALAAVPLWYATNNPLLAVLLVTTVDILGFGPTLRKAYDRPESESLLFFSLIVVRNVLVLMALESYSVTTALFPAAIGTMAATVAAVVVTRRLKLRQRKISRTH